MVVVVEVALGMAVARWGAVAVAVAMLVAVFDGSSSGGGCGG